VSTAAIPVWRQMARHIVAAPGIRYLGPGWPDAGRRIVQTPALATLFRRAIVDGVRPSRVLNAGAGEGLYTPLIRRFAPSAELVEFDFAMPPAGQRYQRRFRASLTHIPLVSSSVDLVLCTEVLEHVADDESAVGELRRVLTPRGALVLSVPTPPAVFDPAHVREGYSLDALSSLFRRHDLEIIEARYCMHAGFQALLRHWRPYRVPLGAIVAVAWADRLLKPGAPMDLLVLAKPRGGASR
jgi:SAM-dependent methyltransferase